LSIAVETLTGAGLRQALPQLARLRITVFRDWPYLYDGTLEYEQEYLSKFAAAENAVIVAARDGEEIIGTATAAPLREHTDEFVPLFERTGFDPDKVFYFGESVLLPAYRGRGLGHAFFDHRERHARSASAGNGTYSHTAFCGVVRRDDHPLRPSDYRPLDGFWTKRGYAKIAGMVGSYTWKDLDQAAETAKPMQFWVRPLP
jgi:GNAT superfamily N-acetyltransferase